MSCLVLTKAAKKVTKSQVVNVEDHKEFKKLLRTKNNVLVAFTEDNKGNVELKKVLKEVSDLVKGHGTIVHIDCSSSDGKKLCKKLKVSNEMTQGSLLKHYKQGEFHKLYDRQINVKSMVSKIK